MNTSDLIALGTLVVAAATLVGAVALFMYRALRERRGVTISASRRQNGPFVVSQLRFPYGRKAASVSRVEFPVTIVINNNRRTPLVVEGVEMDDSAGGVRPSVGGTFRYLVVANEGVELSNPIHFPHQIAPHDALALSGMFQLSVPADAGLPLFRLYCGNIDEQKMTQTVSDLRKHILREIDPRPIGVELIDVEVPEMCIDDMLLQNGDGRALVVPRFGVVSQGAGIDVLAYCQKHGLPSPTTKVPTSTRVIVRVANGKAVVHTFDHSSDPLWFLFKDQG